MTRAVGEYGVVPGGGAGLERHKDIRREGRRCIRRREKIGRRIGTVGSAIPGMTEIPPMDCAKAPDAENRPAQSAAETATVLIAPQTKR